MLDTLESSASATYDSIVESLNMPIGCASPVSGTKIIGHVGAVGIALQQVEPSNRTPVVDKGSQGGAQKTPQTGKDSLNDRCHDLPVGGNMKESVRADEGGPDGPGRSNRGTHMLALTKKPHDLKMLTRIDEKVLDDPGRPDTKDHVPIPAEKMQRTEWIFLRDVNESRNTEEERGHSPWALPKGLDAKRQKWSDPSVAYEEAYDSQIVATRCPSTKEYSTCEKRWCGPEIEFRENALDRDPDGGYVKYTTDRHVPLNVAPGPPRCPLDNMSRMRGEATHHPNVAKSLANSTRDGARGSLPLPCSQIRPCRSALY